MSMEPVPESQEWGARLLPAPQRHVPSAVQQPQSHGHAHSHAPPSASLPGLQQPQPADETLPPLQSDSHGPSLSFAAGKLPSVAELIPSLQAQAMIASSSSSSTSHPANQDDYQPSNGLPTVDLAQERAQAFAAGYAAAHPGYRPQYGLPTDDAIIKRPDAQRSHVPIQSAYYDQSITQESISRAPCPQSSYLRHADDTAAPPRAVPHPSLAATQAQFHQMHLLAQNPYGRIASPYAQQGSHFTPVQASQDGSHLNHAHQHAGTSSQMHMPPHGNPHWPGAQMSPHHTAKHRSPSHINNPQHSIHDPSHSNHSFTYSHVNPPNHHHHHHPSGYGHNPHSQPSNMGRSQNYPPSAHLAFQTMSGLPTRRFTPPDSQSPSRPLANASMAGILNGTEMTFASIQDQLERISRRPSLSGPQSRSGEVDSSASTNLPSPVHSATDMEDCPTFTDQDDSQSHTPAEGFPPGHQLNRVALAFKVKPQEPRADGSSVFSTIEYNPVDPGRKRKEKPPDRPAKRVKMALPVGKLTARRAINMNINPDIWINIFKVMEPSQLFQMPLVCRQWRDMLHEWPSIFRDCRIHYFGFDIPDVPLREEESLLKTMILETLPPDRERHVHRRYLDLLVDGSQTCMSCGSKGVRKVHWAFLQRWCDDCFKMKTFRVSFVHF